LGLDIAEGRELSEESVDQAETKEHVA